MFVIKLFNFYEPLLDAWYKISESNSHKQRNTFKMTLTRTFVTR